MTESGSKTRVATIEVGDCTLEVGDPAGTRVEAASQPDSSGAEVAAELSTALAEDAKAEGRGRTSTEAGADLVDQASATTAKVEQAATIGRGLAQGEVLDPAQLGIELDAVLGLLERLDRDGRWEEALRLARAASTLYSLARRWAALLRSLRAALSAGKALGDLKAVGWAKHELGSLRVAGGDVGGAAQDLGEAREIRSQVGSRREIAVTDHNLQALCRQLRGKPADHVGGRILRLTLPVAAAVALLLLLAGGVAGGVVGSEAGGGGDEGGSARGAALLDGESNGNGADARLLTVNVAGAAGRVESKPRGIECGDDCAEVFPRGKRVTLIARSVDGSSFDEFSGGCDGGNPCELRLMASQSVTATFARSHTLRVMVEGSGTVEGNAGPDTPMISCRADGGMGGYEDEVPRASTDTCVAEFAEGDAVELAVRPDSDHFPSSLSGCDEQGEDRCLVIMDGDHKVEAAFETLR